MIVLCFLHRHGMRRLHWVRRGPRLPQGTMRTTKGRRERRERKARKERRGRRRSNRSFLIHSVYRLPCTTLNMDKHTSFQNSCFDTEKFLMCNRIRNCHKDKWAVWYKCMSDNYRDVTKESRYRTLICQCHMLLLDNICGTISWLHSSNMWLYETMQLSNGELLWQ